MDLYNLKTVPLTDSDRARLIEERTHRGLTQQQVADAIAAHRVTVAKVEKGLACPSPELFVRWCELLEIEHSHTFRLDLKKSRKKTTRKS